MPQILIAAADPELATRLEARFSHEQYAADKVHTFEEAREHLHSGKHDVVILDWEMPGSSGFEILSDARLCGSKVPIIVLMANSSVAEREKILDEGADDCLNKPVNFKELSARVRVALRRAAGSATNTLKAGELELHPQKHKVWKSGVPVELQRSEFALLEFLMRHRGQVFSTEALLERVWGTDTQSGNEAIRCCIKRLRKKIDNDKTPLIITLRGEGYMMDL